MLLRVPEYYKDFECIADKCKDSCCIGWEINVDEDTYDYYKSVEGSFGDRLRSHMAAGEENSFVLEANGRCPFLNDHNLCDICLELGEEALSYVCTEYPRFSIEYGDVMEKNLIMSCEVAGALIFGKREPVCFEEIDQPEAYASEINDEEWMEYEEAYDDIDIEEERELERRAPYVEQARDYMIRILQNRDRKIEERMAQMLLFAEQVQHALNEQQPERIEELLQQYQEIQMNQRVTCPGQEQQDMKERLQAYEELEVLDEEWRTYFEKLKAAYLPEHCEAIEYEQQIQSFLHLQQQQGREYEYEHLLVYFVFRHMMNAVYDCNIIRYAKFAVASYLMIRDMDTLRFQENGGSYSFEDRVDVCRIYAKEVEHSEENMELLANAFLFDDIFTTEHMIQQINRI